MNKTASKIEAKAATGNQSVALHTLVVAAGSGSRFDRHLPKQYHRIGQHTVLEHTLAQLAKSRFVDQVTLVVSADDRWLSQLTLPVRTQCCIGGKLRWQSVANGVTKIAKSAQSKQDLVLIHDAARPCVPVKDIDNVVQAAYTQPYGAILAAPVVDTLKKANSYQDVAYTVSRHHLWQAMTPQVFRLQALQAVLAQVAAQRTGITDEASAFEIQGLPIRLVKGSRQNIKLTHLEDLPLLQAFVSKF